LPRGWSVSGLSGGIRTDNADELICQTAELADRSVGAPSEPDRVSWIVCTGYDALVRPTLAMEAFEVGMIVSEHGTLVGDGISKNNIIAKALACSTCFLDGAHVMP
jgi:hypothetical protein